MGTVCRCRDDTTKRRKDKGGRIKVGLWLRLKGGGPSFRVSRRLATLVYDVVPGSHWIAARFNGLTLSGFSRNGKDVKTPSEYFFDRDHALKGRGYVPRNAASSSKRTAKGVRSLRANRDSTRSNIRF